MTLRRLGLVNGIGLWTLYCKEVQRFLSILMQTVIAPLTTTLLFLVVFGLAVGSRGELATGEVPYLQFLGPGLIMMAVMQNAFANGSTTLMLSKIQGNIVDLLMPPLRPIEIALALVGAAVTRGLLVGVVAYLAVRAFVDLPLFSLGLLMYYVIMASVLLGTLGIMTGVFSEKFDHVAAITNFAITPLAFLSGSFYSITRLPDWGQAIAHVNPFFFLIDGFRYAFIGHADGPIATGMLVAAAINLILLIAMHRIFAKGYRLRQ